MDMANLILIVYKSQQREFPEFKTGGPEIFPELHKNVNIALHRTMIMGSLLRDHENASLT